MNVVVVLLLASIAMTFICAKARAAVPALVAGVFATVLVCSLWSGLAGGIASGAQGVGDGGAKVVSTVQDAAHHTVGQ